MNHTTNLHLPQWEESDRIMMDDFNDAFQKLDAAVAGCTAFTKLKDITTTSSQSELNFDVSDIDWSKWQYIHLDVYVTNANFGASLYVNNDATLCNCYSANSTSPMSSRLCELSGSNSGRFANRVTFEVGKQSNRYVNCHSGLFTGFANILYRDITAIHLTGAPCDPGARIVIWGEA